MKDNKFIEVITEDFNIKAVADDAFDKTSDEPAIEFSRIILMDCLDNKMECYDTKGNLIEIIPYDENTEGRV